MILFLGLTYKYSSKGKKIFALSISLQKDKSMKKYLHLIFLIPLSILSVLQTGCTKKESTTTQTPTPVSNSQWGQMNSPVEGTITSFALYNSKIYVGGNSGLYYSENDCETWNPVTDTLIPGSYFDVTFLKVINNYLFIGGACGISRLNGNQLNFFPANGLQYYSSVSILNQNSMLIMSFYCGVTERSFNNGNTWDSAININGHLGLFSSGQLFLQNDSIYYNTNDGLFKYNSNNNTWKFISYVGFSFLYGFENQLYGIYSPNGGVEISDDYAKTWYQANNGLTDLNTTSITSSDNRVFVSTDTSGVFVSGDLGKHWLTMNSGLLNKKIQLLAVLGDYLYAIDNTNKLWRYQILSGKETVLRKKNNSKTIIELTLFSFSHF